MSELRRWLTDWGAAWNRFWFTPAAPHTLSLIRILAGSMLFYTHLVWGIGLRDFLGPDSWISAADARAAGAGQWYWTPLWYTDSLPVLWTFHLLGLAVIALATIGLWSRVTSVLAWLTALAYVHRLHGALFGLDQTNLMLAMYLMLGSGGDAYSVDAWRRRARGEASPPPRVSTNLAIRLIQVHLCVIYLFGGVGKMQGGPWWDGSAAWYAAANYEYQSLDMTWLGRFPFAIALITHVTTFWEAYYCALVWPRLTRPVALALAVLVHGGIALHMGMITFGLAMLIVNLSFVPPAWVEGTRRRVLGARETGAARAAAERGAGQGRGGE